VKTTDHGETSCPSCGHQLECSTDPMGLAQPKRGDLTVCAYCAAILTYSEWENAGGVLALRAVSAVEIGSLPPHVQRNLAAIVRLIRERPTH
jgi:hypothetical protein